MTDEKKPAEETPANEEMPDKTEQQKINEAYSKASVKDKQDKFYVDFSTKQLRRKGKK